jgi:multicomponent Na+:H+ antiporter subunit F
MTIFVTVLCVLLALVIALTLLLVVLRPGIFDRIIGIGVVGTKTTVLVGFVGVLFGRPDAFVDIVLTYALLNFILVLAVAKYVEQQKEGS